MNYSYLLLIESPGKKNTISRYVGKDYAVISTNGHIYQLSTTGFYRLGLNLENFSLVYELIPKQRLKVREIKEFVNKNRGVKVMIATDPDREGEAIASHLNSEIKKISSASVSRIRFREITKIAVDRAIADPSKLDDQLVHSQEVRRAIDRIIGFLVSSFLRKRTTICRSAGRVQSVALKMIVERDRIREKFVPVSSWEIICRTKEGQDFKFITKEGSSYEYLEKIRNELDRLFIEEKNELKVTRRKKFVQIKNSPLPYSTDMLYRDANKKLGFSSRKTAFVAQKLYEGSTKRRYKTGFITYHRTDSNLITSEEFVKGIKLKIMEMYGGENLRSVMSFSKKRIKQSAHEAIRPIHFDLRPEEVVSFMDIEQLKVYKLIYQRTMQSFMRAAKFDKYDIFVSLSEKYNFVSKITILSQSGFLLTEEDLEKWQQSSQRARNMLTKDNFSPVGFELVEKVSKPKPPFTEASLIKRLRELNIGRPSTYPVIVSKLENWDYIEKKGRILQSTRRGKLAVDVVSKFFSTFVDEKYTGKLESDLDKVADGSLDHKTFLQTFWRLFWNYFSRINKLPYI